MTTVPPNLNPAISYHYLQDTSLSNTTYDHTIEQRSVHTDHDEYEVIAQATCTSRAIATRQNGWIYAVRRRCNYRNSWTCRKLCTALYLTLSDQQTSRKKWKSIGAVHVYSPRPSSTPGTATKPSLGFKVLWLDSLDTETKCGPNFCCCMALL